MNTEFVGQNCRKQLKKDGFHFPLTTKSDSFQLFSQTKQSIVLDQHLLTAAQNNNNKRQGMAEVG